MTITMTIPALSAAKILIVDDISANVAFLKQFLESEGLEIYEEGDPRKVMGLIAKNNFNLILLDINMPYISGTELLSKIRKKFNSTELPIIMITASVKEESIVDALNNGANDYICKPINLDITLARVKNQLLISHITEEKARIKEMNAINSMIITYNHEINNPLSLISICASELEYDNIPGQKDTIEQLKKSIDRIITVVNKIQNITPENLEYESYINDSKMIRLQK